jgi:hypothetical protein
VKRAKRKLPGSPHGTLIRVGGATEVEVKEKKDRVDDATHATRAAVEEGIVPGGGVALLYAAKALDGLTAENSDQVGIVKRALQSPVRRVAENAGDDGSVVVGKLLDSNDRAVTPTDSLRHVFFSTRSESKESEPSNPFQNERKIVARRRRRTSLCNKASLYQEYTWLVKFLVFEPRTQVLTSMPRLPHVQHSLTGCCLLAHPFRQCPGLAKNPGPRATARFASHPVAGAGSAARSPARKPPTHQRAARRRN